MVRLIVDHNKIECQLKENDGNMTVSVIQWGKENSKSSNFGCIIKSIELKSIPFLVAEFEVHWDTIPDTISRLISRWRFTSSFRHPHYLLKESLASPGLNRRVLVKRFYMVGRPDKSDLGTFRILFFPLLPF